MKATKKAKLQAQADALLTQEDLIKLDRVERIKAELKKLSESLKPKIEATVRHFGAGTVLIADRRVKLSESIRNSVSWKSVAYAVAAEDAIDAVKDECTVDYQIFSAVVLR
jgi:hypothetical protein